MSWVASDDKNLNLQGPFDREGPTFSISIWKLLPWEITKQELEITQQELEITQQEWEITKQELEITKQE